MSHADTARDLARLAHTYSYGEQSGFSGSPAVAAALAAEAQVHATLHLAGCVEALTARLDAEEGPR